MKTNVRDTLYRFISYKDSRGGCDWCNRKDREFGILLRMSSPYKREYRICYSCLVRIFEERTKKLDRKKELREGAKSVSEWRAEEQKIKDKRKKEEQLARARAMKKAKEREKNGLLPKTVAPAKSGEPKIEKKDGRTGNTGGGIEQAITFLSAPRTEE